MASLICPRASCLRSLARTGQVYTPVTPIKASFTTSTRPLKQLRLSPEASPRPSVIATRISTQRIANQQSSFTSRQASTSASQTQASTPVTPPPHVLTWDRFFDLRRKRRYLNTGASAITALIAVGVGAPILANQDIDSWGAQISGLDPFIVLGISTFAVAVGGWLCGPSFGSAAFGLWAGRRGWNKAISEKEKSFFGRIRRYRADPSASSPQNPIPDYYGEKIGSVKDYRRWLKDQRTFNRKKTRSFV